jgi:hypothetical protein
MSSNKSSFAKNQLIEAYTVDGVLRASSHFGLLSPTGEISKTAISGAGSSKGFNIKKLTQHQ